MEERCETCRHWTTGDAMLDMEREGWGLCDMTINGAYVDDRHSRAVAEDAEHYYACLLTRPDFGCVQWEAKE